MRVIAVPRCVRAAMTSAGAGALGAGPGGGAAGAPGAGPGGGSDEALILGLGGNLGGDEALLARFAAVATVFAARGAVRASRVYRSAALTPGDPAFLNAALAIGFACEPAVDALLDELQALEVRHGRDRAAEGRWGPRPLDLDVLAWGARPIATARLIVPHPRAHERSFALRPLIDLRGAACVLPGMTASLGALARDAGPAIVATDYAIELIAPAGATTFQGP